MPLQLKCMNKIMKQNAPIYATLSGVAGFKIALGKEVFSNITFKLIKLILK